MKFSKVELTEAAQQKGLTQDQTAGLLALLEKGREGQAQFSLSHVIYYLGGLMIISAMSWFMVKEWETLGGGGIAAVATAYALLLFTAGAALWRKPNWKIPAGILLTAGVWMTPLIIYGIQRKTGTWLFGDPGIYRDYYHWIKGGWFAMELGTVIVGLITLRFFRFPFLMFPISFALFFMSMDLGAILFSDYYSAWDGRRAMSMVFGLMMLFGSYLVDLVRKEKKIKEDFAFWGYLFGTLAFWCAMTSVQSDHWIAKPTYCFINLVMIFGSVFVNRKVLAVFGALGVFIYIGDLASNHFMNSMAFPFVLSGLGALVIGAGIFYQRYEPKLSAWMSHSLPEALKRLRPIDR